MNERNHHLSDSETVRELPLACSNETAAVEFLEKQRWGTCPCCVHCGSVNVYKMMDRKTGERNKRFLWKCKDCGKQYTVRIGAVYEESRIELRHWCYAFWRAATSKKGASALEIKRHCQIGYKAALFLMHRIRFAMAPDNETTPPLKGTVECDETYIGGKPRDKRHDNRKTWRNRKVAVLAMVERGGNVRTRRVTNVTSANIRRHLRNHIDPSARIITDEFSSYKGIGKHFAGGHETVNHRDYEYVRGDVTTNTIESFFAIVKRGLNGIYHAVSHHHLPRYLAEYEFRYNHRQMNDGERTVAAIRAADGKRLFYKQPVKKSA